MAAVFDHLGIRFQYPENWALETEQDGEDFEVTVFSPTGGFWSVAASEADPQAVADLVVETMSEQYQDLDSEAVSESIGGQKLIGYDLNFYCLDLTNTARVRTFRREPRTYLILSQAEDRDLAALAPIFHAMTTSFISHP